MPMVYPPSPRTVIYDVPVTPQSHHYSGNPGDLEAIADSLLQDKTPQHEMHANSALSPSQSPSSSTHPSAVASALAHRHPSSTFQNMQDQPVHPSTLNPPNVRRQSRFDPMGHDEDGEVFEEGGFRHPLRRVNEEESEHFSLPSLKSLFGTGRFDKTTELKIDHPPTPATSTHPPFLSGSLSSFSSSTGSPASSRTSRYSSLGSSSSGESHLSSGWWAPDGSSASSRSQSFPLSLIDEPDAKRRRSDFPISTKDPEEMARLKWQSQSRNASFPNVNPGSNIRPSLSMSARASISGAPISPPLEHGGAYAFNRRELSVPSRSPSFSGQLSRSFADLSATERGDMLPPMTTQAPQVPDRRPSMLRPPSFEDKPLSPSGLRSSPVQVPPPDSRISRQSTPDRAHSSLTEQIMANSGDDVAMANGRYHLPVSISDAPPSSIPMLKSSLSEPNQVTPGTWGRRGSNESVRSVPPISLNSDNEGLGSSISIRRQRVLPSRDGDDKNTDPMRGMEILAESAKRAAAFAQEEGKRNVGSEEREVTPEGMDGMVIVPGAAGPKYRCAYCAKTFSRPSSLRIHTYSRMLGSAFLKEPFRIADL